MYPILVLNCKIISQTTSKTLKNLSDYVIHYTDDWGFIKIMGVFQ